MHGMIGFVWTKEREQFLLERWAAGDSGRSIADELGVTRSTVMGKIARLKLQRGTGTRNTGKRRERRRPDISIRAAAMHAKPEGPVCKPDPVVRSEVSAKAFGEPCDILDLATDHCRWPTTDAPPHLFCNAKTPAGLPYCPAHMRISYRPAKRAA